MTATLLRALQVTVSMLLSLPSSNSLSSLIPLSTITTLASLTTSVRASTANFCPVEGSDYFDKPDGNIVKVV